MRNVGKKRKNKGLTMLPILFIALFAGGMSFAKTKDANFEEELTEAKIVDSTNVENTTENANDTAKENTTENANDDAKENTTEVKTKESNVLLAAKKDTGNSVENKKVSSNNTATTGKKPHPLRGKAPTGNINKVSEQDPYINENSTSKEEAKPLSNEEKVKIFCKGGFQFSSGSYMSVNSLKNNLAIEALGSNAASHKLRFVTHVTIPSTAISVNGNKVVIKLDNINLATLFDSAHTESAIQNKSVLNGKSFEKAFSNEISALIPKVNNLAKADLRFIMEEFLPSISSQIKQATGVSVSVSLN